MKFKTLDEQNKKIIEIIKTNNKIFNILKFLDEIKLPHFYIVSGSVYQTVWNYLDGRDPSFGINDIDIVYYDKDHLTMEDEMSIEIAIRNEFSTYGFDIDIHNEARMSIWRKPNENPNIANYESAEDAISQLLTTVQAVGVTMVNGDVKVFAPFGLSDVFTKTIRPTGLSTNSKELYEKKVTSWKSRFDGLQIIEWRY